MPKKTESSAAQAVIEAIARLERSSEVVLDVETSGLDPKRNHIVGYVLTFGPAPADTYYLPVRHGGGGNIKSEGTNIPDTPDGWNRKTARWEQALLMALNRPGLRVIGHNLGFDLKFLWAAGLTELDATYEDTQVNAALIDEWQPRFSLDYCAQRAELPIKKLTSIYEYLIQKFNLPENDRGAMGHYWRLAGDDPMGVDYAKLDGTATWLLRDWQRRELDGQDLGRVHSVESRLVPVLVRQTMFGIKIDEEQLHWAKEYAESKIEELLGFFPSGFNPKSPGDVRAYCEKHGNVDWPLTPKKGQPSFPESWLLTHDAGRKIVAVRKWQTMLSSFVMPMIETHLWHGRVHPNYNQLRGDEFGTITGRLSSDSPNQQQAPKRDMVTGHFYRSIFTTDEGMIWGSRDYSQCEPRLLAMYSRAKVLMDDYLNNPDADAHQAVANATGFDRQTGKRVNQTLLTGGGQGVLVSKYGMSEADARKAFDDYFQRLPEVKKLQKTASEVMRRRGYVKSLLNRRARLLRPDKAYVAVNRLLQCGNADILKLKMVEIDDYLKSEGRPADMLFSAHDAIEFQFPETNRDAYTKCGEIMSYFGPDCAIQLDVPMPTDAGEGPNWAVATYGEDYRPEHQLEREWSKNG